MKSKIKQIFNQFIDGITENRYVFYLVCILLLAVSIIIRMQFLGYQSPDYIIFLQNWWDTIKSNGVIHSFGMDIGDYTNFYLIILSIRNQNYHKFAGIYKAG